MPSNPGSLVSRVTSDPSAFITYMSDFCAVHSSPLGPTLRNPKTLNAIRPEGTRESADASVGTGESVGAGRTGVVSGPAFQASMVASMSGSGARVTQAVSHTTVSSPIAMAALRPKTPTSIIPAKSLTRTRYGAGIHPQRGAPPQPRKQSITPLNPITWWILVHFTIRPPRLSR